MAEDKVYADHSEYIIGEGTLTRDAKEIGSNGIVAIDVAANYTKWNGDQGVNYRSIIVRKPWAADVKNYKKGDRVTYAGKVEGDNWEKDGQKRHSEKVIADQIGLSSKFRAYKKGSGSNGPAQSSRNDDDEPPFDTGSKSSSSNDDGGLDLDSLI